MPVDNTIYDTGVWWDDNDPFATLLAMNPARFGYFRDVITEKLGRDPAGLRALDVGCGGGLLAEEFARLGCDVTGIDLSEPSLEAARTHARSSGLDIEYVLGDAAEIPFPDNHFDVVYCCDVLEHVPDLDRTVAEAARVLRPGGVYLYDTINRTFQSWLWAIKINQESLLGWAPKNTHAWENFIRPEELDAALCHHGMVPQETVGMGPTKHPLTIVWLMLQRRLGRITYGEFGRQSGISIIPDTAVQLIGYSIKAVTGDRLNGRGNAGA